MGATGSVRAREVIYQRPWMYPKQLAAIFCPERYGVVEASTKSGKTVGCMAWLLEQAAIRGKRGRNYWWIAPVFAQTKIAFRRMKLGLPRSLYVANESELWIRLANDATIWFKSADNTDSLYGEDVYAAVLDEATRAKEEAFFAIRTTLTATRGPLRIIGNVKGKKNWAYRMARRAAAGEPDMHYARITAADAVAAGVLAQAEIDDARRTLPTHVFQELYEAEAADDSTNPFGERAIAACLGPITFGHAAVWGIDLGKAQDWTVLHALDRDGRTVAWERFQKPWPETIATITRTVKGVHTLIDSTGVGDPIVEQIQRETGTQVEGFTFTRPSKQRIMEGLAAAIQHQRIQFPAGNLQWPTVVQDELESFEYAYTATGVRYAAPDGLHDDTVCALALAVEHLRAHGAGSQVRLWGGGVVDDDAEVAA